jgi:hypothetical protein
MSEIIASPDGNKPQEPNEIVKFSDADNHVEVSKEDDVSPKDVFRFAKQVLLYLLGLYTLIAVSYLVFSQINGNKEAIKDVWDFTKVAVNSLVSLVIGFYFGNRTQQKRS